MQQELTTINTEIAAVCEAQMALHTLMEGISTWLGNVPETKPPPEELLNRKAMRLAKAWELECFWVAFRTDGAIGHDS